MTTSGQTRGPGGPLAAGGMVEGNAPAAASGKERRPSGLAEIDRQRRQVWTAAFVCLVAVSLAVVVMSYYTDVFPASVRQAVDFAGWRFVFLILSVAFIVYAIQRERMFRRVTKRLIERHEQATSLAELDRLRNDLVATVTHELKTPLTSLLGYATILRKRAATLSDEQRNEFIGIMERQGQRIMHLIEELLQSSRVKEGMGRLQRVPIDLAELVRSVVREFSVGREWPIDVDVPPQDLGLFGDPAAMEHILTNLLDNAMKYSEPQGSIHVAVIDREGEVLLTVRDEGQGIDPEQVGHIFERFQQATNARGSASVGLGLYIVKNLVEAQGGIVTVDSEPGKGSTFTVSLRRRRISAR